MSSGHEPHVGASAAVLEGEETGPMYGAVESGLPRASPGELGQQGAGDRGYRRRQVDNSPNVPGEGPRNLTAGVQGGDWDVDCYSQTELVRRRLLLLDKGLWYSQRYLR